MPFLRGTALPTSTTLGYADGSDLGPTAGNGFFTRWPDDLATLQELGLTDVRLALDWARLQPAPDRVDDGWVERFEQIVAAADAIGLRVWATLHDGSVPRWFDNEGGLDDDEAFTRWWPRWVEAAADKFGDRVRGWVPFAEIPLGAPTQPWRDTWGILAGVHPVVASLGPADEAFERYDGCLDVLGLVLRPDWERDGTVGDRELDAAMERWGRRLRDSADAVDAPLVVSQFRPFHDDADTAGEIVGRLVSALDDAIDDGVPLEACFVEPGISAPDAPGGLLDGDRSPTPAAERYLS
jgi:beta-glucosidase